MLLHGGVPHETHATSKPNQPDEGYPPPPAVTVAAPAIASPSPVITPAAVGDQLLPDVFPLISDPDDYVYGWTLDETEIPGRTLLRLTTAVANSGRGAMELRGSTVNPDGTQNVLQRIYLEGGGFADRVAGTFSYHPGHGHIHFDGFAAYHLREVTTGNGVGPVVASGDKVSFCLLDIDRYDPTLPGSPASSVYNSCGQVQGISVGWADVYHQSLDDQWIDVTDVANGQYWLEVVSDPDNHLAESNENNNVDRILINLTLPSEEPIVESHSPAGAALAPADHVEFVFNERMNPASFTVAGDIVSFTGPGGTNLLGQISGHSWSAGDRRLRVHFTAQSAVGTYTMTIGPNVLAFDNGNPMDQDGDGVLGEIPGDRYAANFTLQTSIGPDAFGYRAFANPFQAIDLVLGQPGVFNIAALDDDDAATPVSLGTGNTFNFYGASYPSSGSMYVSSNGLITFGGGVTDVTNSDLTSQPTLRTISPLWDDWIAGLSSADAVLGKIEDLNADGISDRLIIEWSEVRHYPSSPSPITFQAILHLNTGGSPGAMVFNYVDVDTGDGTANGNEATIGIKDLGTQGARRLLLSRNRTGLITSGSALRITTSSVGMTADIIDVAPDPRDTPVDSIAINFSEKVGGFTLADLVLQRDDGANLLTGSGATLVTSDGGMTWTLGSLASLTGPVGAYRLTLASAGSGITGLGGNPLGADAVETWNCLAGLSAPRVTKVFVGSTAWTPAFLNHLQSASLGESAFGYAIDPANQLDELPWINLNKVSVRFSRNVNVAQGNLAVTGINVASYTTTAIAYDPATFTATWTLDTTGVGPEKLALQLTGVTDVATGLALDGEWQQPVPPPYHSGDGIPGGDFNYRVFILPGDANRSGGSVIGSDVILVRNAQNFSPGTGFYTIFKDVNGSGSILGSDVIAVRNRQGLSLPPEAPAVVANLRLAPTSQMTALSPPKRALELASLTTSETELEDLPFPRRR